MVRAGIFILVILCPQLRAEAASNPSKPAITYQGTRASFKVDTVRCLPTLLQGLSKLYGWRIAYEDAPLSYLGDVVDVTARTYQSKDDQDRALDAKGGPLDVSFEVPAVGQAPPEAQAAQIIRDVLARYEQLKYPGRYKLEISSKGVMHVLPFEVKNHDGTPTKVVPVLDTNISFQSQQEISGERAMQQICQAVSRMTGARVLHGGIADNRLFQLKLRLPDTPVVARDVTDSVAIESGVSRFWELLYDPGAKMYALNVVH